MPELGFGLDAGCRFFYPCDCEYASAYKHFKLHLIFLFSVVYVLTTSTTALITL